MPELALPDGSRIAYSRSGSGRPVVLLSGALSTRHALHPLARALEPHVEVISLDYRSHGDSPVATHGHTVDQFARDLRELVRHEGLRDVALIGWSMGALVGWEYVAQSTEESKPAALVSIGQSPSDLRRDDWPEGPLTQDSVFELARAVQRDPAAALKTVFDDEALYAESLRIDAAAATLLLLDQTFRDYRPTVRSAEIPTLVIAGEHDPFVSASQEQWLIESAPALQTTRIPGAGHMAPVEAPLLVAQSIVGFLAGLPRR